MKKWTLTNVYTVESQSNHEILGVFETSSLAHANMSDLGSGTMIVTRPGFVEDGNERVSVNNQIYELGRKHKKKIEKKAIEISKEDMVTLNKLRSLARELSEGVDKQLTITVGARVVWNSDVKCDIYTNEKQVWEALQIEEDRLRKDIDKTIKQIWKDSTALAKKYGRKPSEFFETYIEP